MDRDLFKSYAEMMRLTSLNVMWGIKSEFYDELAAMLLDLKDAFQSTSTRSSLTDRSRRASASSSRSRRPASRSTAPTARSSCADSYVTCRAASTRLRGSTSA